MTMGQGISLAGLYFPVFRLLILIGIVRTIARREWPSAQYCKTDRLVLAFAAWTTLASLFHRWENGSGPIYTIGFLINIIGVYYLIRCWCTSESDLETFAISLGLILLPVALEMVFEQMSAKNLFSIFGRVSPDVLVRDGRLRSQGPFLHPILAGTVGATCIPLFIGATLARPTLGAIGLIGACLMIAASRSTGPILSAVTGLLFLASWPLRHHLKRVPILLFSTYFILNILSTRPAYYFLLSSMDLTGSSTGYYRARLIHTSIEHLSEWWLFGTDYTIHWIPSGIGSIINENHIDFTNYYLLFGVLGGLPSLLLLLLAFTQPFRDAVPALSTPSLDSKSGFLLWCILASLASHIVTGISVSYFDQSALFPWATVALASSLNLHIPQEKLDESLEEQY